jgi:hypothetical protein
MKIELILPIKTVSEANISEHWTKASKRHRQQQQIVRLAFITHKTHISLPCCVKMTRLAPNYLDEDDNLRMALKWVKDEVSECISDMPKSFYFQKGKLRQLKGRHDDDKRIKWEYAQEKSNIRRVKIEITFEDDKCCAQESQDETLNP